MPYKKESLDRPRSPGLVKAIEAAGSATALAAKLGISQVAVTCWRNVPAARVVEVEIVTGVSRRELRPDLYEGME